MNKLTTPDSLKEIQQPPLILSLLTLLGNYYQPLKYVKTLSSYILEFHSLSLIIIAAFLQQSESKSDSLSKFVIKASKFITLHSLKSPQNSNDETQLFLILCIYTILLFILIILAAILGLKSKNPRIKYVSQLIFKGVFLLHLKGSAVYLTQISGALIFSEPYDDNINTNINSNNFKGSKFLIIITTIFFVIHIIIISAITLCLKESYQYDITSARPHRTSDFLLILMNIILVLVLRANISKDSQQWLSVIIGLIILISRSYVVTVKWQYFDYSANKTLAKKSFALLSISILQVISLMTNMKFNNFTYSLLFVVIFGYKLGSLIFEQSALQVSALNFKEIKSVNQLFIKLSILLHTIEKGTQSDHFNRKVSKYSERLTYKGLLHEHIMSCKDSLCNCSKLDGVRRNLVTGSLTGSQGLNNNSYSNQTTHTILPEFENETQKSSYIYGILILELLQHGLQSVNEGDLTQVYLMQSYHTLKTQEGSYLKSLMILFMKKVEKNMGRITKAARQSLIYYIKDQNRQNLQHVKDRQLVYTEFVDVETVHRIDSLRSKLKTMIRRNTERYLKFWNTFQENNCTAKELFRQAYTVNKTSAEILKFQESLGIYKSQLSSTLEFSFYLGVIANRPFKANKLLKTFFKHQIAKKIHKQLPIAHNNLSFELDLLIYFDPLTFKPLSLSQNCTQIWGHTMIGDSNSTIKTFLPSYYHPLIDAYINNEIKISDKLFLNKNFSSYN